MENANNFFTLKSSLTPRVSTSDRAKFSQLHECNIKLFKPIHQGLPTMQQIAFQRIFARKALTPNHFKSDIRLEECRTTKSNTLKRFFDGINSTAARIYPVTRKKSKTVKLEEVTKNLFQQNRFKKMMIKNPKHSARTKKRLLCTGRSCKDFTIPIPNTATIKSVRLINEEESSPRLTINEGEASRFTTMMIQPKKLIKSFGSEPRQSAPPSQATQPVKPIKEISNSNTVSPKKLVSVGIETDRRYVKHFS